MGSRSRTVEEISVFTTMRVGADGDVRFWEDHLARLAEGAARFGLRPVTPSALRAAIERATERIADARVRVRLRRDAPFEIQARPYTPPVDAWILQPVAVSPDEDTVRFKTSRREVYEDANRKAASGRFALLTDARGRYLECAIANLFFARGTRLLTPPSSAPILPGIARKRLIEAAPRVGFEVVEADCRVETAAAAEACVVTNALFGVHPVAEITGLRAFPDLGLARRLNLALAT